MPHVRPPMAGTAQDAAKPQWRLCFRFFRGTLESWESLFSDAAAFATEVGPERLVSVSHSEDANDGVVTVWYWTNDQDVPSPESDESLS